MSLLLNSILTSLNAVFAILIVGLSALALVQLGVIHKSAERPISRITINLLLPSLIFSELLANLEPTDLLMFLCITLISIIHILLGTALGWAVASLLKEENGVKRLMSICCGFFNLTIALMFTEMLGKSEVTLSDGQFHHKVLQNVLSCYAINGFSIWFGAFSVMKKKTNKGYFLEEPKRSLLETFLKKLRSGINPPVIAILLALPVVFIPQIRDTLFIGKTALFHNNLYAALDMMGSSAPMLIIFLIGIKLSGGYSSSATISWWSIVLVIAIKLVLIPWVGITAMYLLYKAQVVSRILAMSLVILWSSPSALQLFMVCSAQKNQEENIAKIYTVMYMVSPITLVINNFISLNLFYE